MNNLYFDANPLIEFNFDYNGAGSRSGVFTWYDPLKTGILHAPSGLISTVDKIPASGTFVIGSTMKKPDAISFNYTSYPTYNCIAIEKGGVVDTYSSTFSPINSFSGFYPRFMTMDGFGGTGAYCFYQRNGDIFYRRRTENFSTERQLTNRGDIIRPTFSFIRGGNYMEFYMVTSGHNTIVFKFKK